jgi:methionyl-tRNA formyltransferase
VRILFLGTPEFAVPSLERLIAWKEVSVVGLVSQPDRPAGRGKNIFPPPTKLVALSHGIPVLQPERLSKEPDIVQSMRDLKPDILVTVAFGQILKTSVLEMAPHGVMNVHGSLLPRYRGAAPINWTIINGESLTGVTTMFSDKGVDTGKMLLTREMRLDDDMDAETLGDQMSIVGADLLVETLKSLMAGTLVPRVQDESQASYAPRLEKEMGNIDWRKPALEIHNLVRGLLPWPGTYTCFDSLPVKILRTNIVLQDRQEAREPGTIKISENGKFLVSCGADGSDLLEILEVKPASKGKMTALSWSNGLRLKSGAVLRML